MEVGLEVAHDLADRVPDDELLAPLGERLKRLALAVKDGPVAVVQHGLGRILQRVVELARRRRRGREVLVEGEEELQASRVSAPSSQRGGTVAKLTASSPHSSQRSLIHLALTPARTSLTTPPTPAVAAVVWPSAPGRIPNESDSNASSADVMRAAYDWRSGRCSERRNGSVCRSGSGR